MSYICVCQVEIPVTQLHSSPQAWAGSTENICWEYSYIWGWFVPPRIQLEIIDRKICSHRQTTLLS